MKVIGLSGAQGAGKSSMLKELMSRGWQLDQFRVSRAVQAQLGWDSLDHVMFSFEKMVDFQNEVFLQKFNHDSELNNHEDARTIDAKGHVVLTERTFADIWAYTSLWTWRFHERGEVSFEDALKFLTPYTQKCAEAQLQVYSGVLLLPLMEHVNFENDPNRAARADAITVYEDIDRFVERKSPFMKKLVITTKTVGERADQVETFLRSL